MCCNPLGTSSAALALLPLSNAFWVDAGTAVATANQTGSIAAPFSTVTQGVNKIGDGNAGSLLILSGDYTAEAAISIGTRKLSLVGMGRGVSPDVVTRPKLPAFNGAGEIAASDVQIDSVGATVAVVGLQLMRCNVTGEIHVTTNLNLQNSSQAGNVTVDGTGGGGKVTAVDSGLNGTWNIVGGGTGGTNAPQVDEQSWASLLFQGVKRSDANPDWNVRHELMAHIQDAIRTIDSTYYGFGISTGTLTANRTVTVTQDASLAVGAQFRIDRYDVSNNSITFAGSIGGSVALTNAALTRNRYFCQNAAGPTIAFQNLARLATS